MNERVFNAALSGNLEHLRVLVNALNVNVVDGSGCSALHVSALDGHLACVRYLVQLGGSVNAVDGMGRSALHCAAHGGHVNCVRYLVEEGADVNAADSEAWTALLHATHKGHIECIRYLSKVGADVNALNSDGSSALHAAAQEGFTECVQCLLQFGANVSAANNDGFTPLHAAAQYGHVDILRIFLRAEASVHAMSTPLRYTPLFNSILANAKEAARLLIAVGARVEDVVLDDKLPVIPDWVNEFASARLLCRRATIALIGAHKFHRTCVIGSSDVNVVRLIGRFVWESRLDNAWIVHDDN
jgi:ankyrin repeat protein